MRAAILNSALLLLFVVASISVGFGARAADEAGSEEVASATAVPAEIPYEAKWANNLREGTPESIDNGKTIFSSQCTMCHGKSGDGKGDLALRLGYEIPDFTSAAVQKARTDGEWFYILTNGHGKMSGEGKRLSENVRWDLVNFLRSLAPSSGG